MQTYTLKVVELRKETNDTITVCFKQPGLKKIKYLPGQYLTLVLRINGRRYIRPYSFSSAPQVDAYLEVTVKRVQGGVVSNHICDKLKVDDIVEVMPPMGDFTFNSTEIPTDKQIVLWGAGSGITPLMSIAKYILKQQTGHNVTLVYGNRHVDEVIFAEEIRSLQQEFHSQIHVWNFYTRLQVDQQNPNIVQGRIDPHKVLNVLNTVGDLQNTVHYICGPTGLKESVTKALNSLGIPQQQINTEDFEIVKDPKEFEDVITRNVQITVDNTSVCVEVVKGKSILEAGLDALMELPYSCQTGSCTLCKAVVVSGKMKTIGLTKLPGNIAENECLMCCTYPLSDDIELIVE
jgi:ring-1,2-phenylacetyl-CoA epoxidase subunit PaaE